MTATEIGFLLYNIIFQRLIKSVFNQRNILTLPLNFIINFAPVFIWLNLFNYAKYIPNGIRPAIHSKLAFIMDNYLFGDVFNELGEQYGKQNLDKLTIATSLCFMILILLLLPLSIWYYIYYIKHCKRNLLEWNDTVFHFEQSTNFKRLRLLIFPYLVPLLSFIVLNIMHLFSNQTQENFTKTKDLLAWTSYVIFHVMVPILTAVYLYIFHAPGMVKWFGISMGVQNLAGIFTHLLIPTASPWFTHLYGINDTEHATYQQEGFAAGLIRVDNHLGTHLNTNGFHKSPIVFGAVPSLHSAIAFQCFLFIMTRAGSLKHRFAQLSSSSYPNNSNNEIDEDIEQVMEGSSLSLTSTSDNETDDTFELQSFQKTTPTRTTTNNKFIPLYDYDTQVANNWKFKIFNKGLFPKLLISGYICLQWWATMYLDHHYRFDLFIGMLYSLITFSLTNYFFIQPNVLSNWLDIRSGQIDDSSNEARTYGMRVFKGTKYEWFFDPLA